MLELLQGQGQVVQLRDILVSLGDSILRLELFDLCLRFVERFDEVPFPFLQSTQRDTVLLLKFCFAAINKISRIKLDLFTASNKVSPVQLGVVIVSNKISPICSILLLCEILTGPCWGCFVTKQGMLGGE